MNPTKAELDGLCRLLDYCFNENELRNLCLDWGIDYENLGGGNKAARAGGLVFYLARKGRLSQLVQTCSQLRPNAPWATPTTRYEPYAAGTLAQLSRMLAEHFDQDQVRDVCATMQVDVKRLPGVDQGGAARELVLYLARRERIAELVQVCSERRPDIPWKDALGQARREQPAAKASALPVDRSKMHQMLDYCFNENELQDLCLELGIDCQNLHGESKTARTRELVAYFSHPKRDMGRLVGACARLRPNAPWMAPTDRYEPYAVITLAQLSRLLREHFDQDQVRDVCSALQVDAKRLPGADQGGAARELVLYLARRERVAELVQVCSHRRPDIPWQDALNRAQSERAVPEAAARTVDATKLRQMLDAHFTQDQLRDVCLETGIDYDNIPGPDTIRGLVQYFERRSGVPELAAACSRLRPDLSW